MTLTKKEPLPGVPHEQLPMGEPPPYSPSAADDTATAEGSSVTTAAASLVAIDGPSPPSDAQRAEAPLRVEKSDMSIKGEYLVSLEGPSPTSAPDVFLRTTNSRISPSVWIESGDWGRPVVIEAKTTNSNIEMAVSTLGANQPVDITAETTNSHIKFALPASFEGILTMSTTNGHQDLSPELQARSVRVSLNEPVDKQAVTYRIGEKGGKSSALLKTTNSNIKAGLVTDAAAFGKGGDGKGKDRGCALM